MPVHALRGVSLDVFPGELLAIEGPSGGGKSTLLNVLGLLQTTTEGTYVVDGINATSLPDPARTRLRSQTCSFVFQSFHMLAGRPARDGVSIALSYSGLPSDQVASRVEKALETVGLDGFGNQNASTLSGGQQQRVAIARALATGAPVLIADEPTGNLDSENASQVLSALCELRDAGVAVVIATHEASVADKADRRVRVLDGEIVGDPAPPDGVLAAAVRSENAARELKPTRRTARDVVADAVASLRSRPSRTAGLVSAVAVAVGLVVGTLGFGTTARAQVSDAFDARANRYVTVEKDAVDLTVQTDTSGWNSPDPVEAVSALTHIAGVDSAAILVDGDQTPVAARPDKTAISLPAYRADGDFQEATDSEIQWAAGYAGDAGRVAIVGVNAASNLDLSPVDSWPVIWLDGSPCVVVGLIESSPRVPLLTGSIVVLEDDDSSTGLALDTQAATFLLTVGPGAASQVASQARLAIHPQDPAALRVSVPQDPRDLRQEIEGSVATSLAVLSLVAIAAAVLALANAMNLTVSWRRSEFGLRRALGASPGDLFRLVLVESTLVGVAGGFLGMLAGYLVILCITIANRWTPVVEPSLVPLAVAGGVCVGALAGVVAALQASRIDPALSLRM
ncbi:ABC transporter ATP-binding protein/permease [Demequina aestuarii]|uniref:ABC transporter ATP-binding protein/permease n=1 Tax=Demequina aestuarii TaxID=327095 RepID=UPI000783CCDF|nr:ABC transporter ATP-binding protein/permease [Demequina aestuarii]